MERTIIGIDPHKRSHTAVVLDQRSELLLPTFVQHGVVHDGVTNVPGRCAETATTVLFAAAAPRFAALVRDANQPTLVAVPNVG